MRRFQIVVNWVPFGTDFDETNTDRRFFFVNAKTEDEALAIFRKDNGERHPIVRVLNRGNVK